MLFVVEHHQLQSFPIIVASAFPPFQRKMYLHRERQRSHSSVINNVRDRFSHSPMILNYTQQAPVVTNHSFSARLIYIYNIYDWEFVHVAAKPLCWHNTASFFHRAEEHAATVCLRLNKRCFHKAFSPAAAAFLAPSAVGKHGIRWHPS